jgi:hypothetical protein
MNQTIIKEKLDEKYNHEDRFHNIHIKSIQTLKKFPKSFQKVSKKVSKKFPKVSKSFQKFIIMKKC